MIGLIQSVIARLTVKSLVCVFSLAVTTLIYAQELPVELWQKRFDGSVGVDTANPFLWSDCARAITVDASGNTYVLGITERSGYPGYVVVNYDPDGNASRIIGTGDFTGQGGISLGDVSSAGVIGIETDSSGNIYVAGTTGSLLYSADIFVSKYNATGSLLWTKTYDRDPGVMEIDRDDVAVAFALDPSGNAVVTGTTEGCSYTGNCWPEQVTLKYNSSGTLLWERFFNGGIASDAVAMVLDDAGDNIYVAGSRGIVRYNTSGTEECHSILSHEATYDIDVDS
jgi:hypothetical protein